jgi:hypothetical protein
MADSPPDPDANSQGRLANGYPSVPDHLLTSHSSSGDGAEFFTPSENLVLKTDEEQAPSSYLIAPFPPDELERRKALYRQVHLIHPTTPSHHLLRFNILHTSRDVNFDRITHLCKLVFSTKMVIISLIDGDEQ